MSYWDKMNIVIWIFLPGSVATLGTMLLVEWHKNKFKEKYWWRKNG